MATGTSFGYFNVPSSGQIQMSKIMNYEWIGQGKTLNGRGIDDLINYKYKLYVHEATLTQLT